MKKLKYTAVSLIFFVFCVGYAFYSVKGSDWEAFLDEFSTDQVNHEITDRFQPTNIPVVLESKGVEKRSNCWEPANYEIIELDPVKAVVLLDDVVNTNWEYFVQLQGGGQPTTAGFMSNSKRITITRMVGGVNLQPDTAYEFYVRSVCSPGVTSFWEGPIVFKTPCLPMVPPFWERFSDISKSAQCWRTTLKGHRMSVNATSVQNRNVYIGNRSVELTNKEGDQVWLASPTFITDPKKVYRLKFHYLADFPEGKNFDLMISHGGIAAAEFVSIKNIPLVKDWREFKIFLTDLQAKTTFAILYGGVNRVMTIDNFYFEEVIGCQEPMSAISKNIQSNKVDLEWTDDQGKEWEYLIREKGTGTGIPVAKGVKTKLKQQTVLQEINGKKIKPNSKYEYFIRTVCGNGAYSVWLGPLEFTTPCNNVEIPFWEGFNKGSKSLNCWTVKSVNHNTINQWMPHSDFVQEGSQSMGALITSFVESKSNGETWLISPMINFDKNKKYKLSFYYKTSDDIGAHFEILASDHGNEIKDFTKVLVAKKHYKTAEFQKLEYFISDLSANTHLTWRAFEKDSRLLLIDNVLIEEVRGCEVPFGLNVKDVDVDKVTLSWDALANNLGWEYAVQLRASGIPKGKFKSTSTKDNVITKDNMGNLLKANTSYEFYVRSKCMGDQISSWSEPYFFSTNCAVITPPFWEGFNSNSETINCWSVIDIKNVQSVLKSDNWSFNGKWNLPKSYGNSVFEGDGIVQIIDHNPKNATQWLISPSLKLDGGVYVLKYQYRTINTEVNNAGFEVFLSQEGVIMDKFTTKVVAKKAISKDNVWQEEVVFIRDITGIVNLGWKYTGVSSSPGIPIIDLDHVSLKKVETCSEPYGIKKTNYSANGFVIEWEQDGGIVDWEVALLDYGTDILTANPTWIAVTGKPTLAISNLISGKVYQVYVRAKCKNNSTTSDWSTPLKVEIPIPTANNCQGAIKVPVNKGVDCEVSVTTSMFETGVSGLLRTTCSDLNFSSEIKSELWFEFVATATQHAISLVNNYDWVNENRSFISYAIYEENCLTLNHNTENIGCYILGNTQLLDNLVVGKTYLIRVLRVVRKDMSEVPNPDLTLNICITSYSGPYIQVKPIGDQYTPLNLVKDVLADTSCDLISNVTHNPSENGVISLGYFNKNSTNFPFEEGLVLSTSSVNEIPGPFKNNIDPRNNSPWNKVRKAKISPGSVDSDVEMIYKNDLNANNYYSWSGEKYINVIEFDFVPLSENFQLEYIYASDYWNHYYGGGTYTYWNNLGAIWLTEVETGEGRNIANITQDELAISTETISSGYSYFYSYDYQSRNKEYFDKIFEENRNESSRLILDTNPLGAPINFSGMTLPIKTQSVLVKPGVKYRLKVAVTDIYFSYYNQDNYYNSSSSALFINGGSLNLDRLDLGEDLLIKNLEALCAGDKIIVNSGLSKDKTTIQWYKDGKKLAGQILPDLEVTEAGTYKVVARYDTVDCDVTGEIKVEMYPLISAVLGKPNTIKICKNNLNVTTVDLTAVENQLFAGLDKSRYHVRYFEDKTQAEKNVLFIEKPAEFATTTVKENKDIYLRIEDEVTGCVEIIVIMIEVSKGDAPKKREDVVACMSYVFPELSVKDQFYYSGSAAQGKSYVAGDRLDVLGQHTIYVLQLNGKEGCYEEISYQVTITPNVVAAVFEDEVLECKYYQLKPLLANNKYFTKSGGQGVELKAGDLVTASQTIYVFAQSLDQQCTDESSFTITYKDCPIPKGISPNGDGFNDRFDLSEHGVNSIVIYNRWGVEVYSYGSGYQAQWQGQDKKGNTLADGTYYYIIDAHGKTRTGWVQINK